MNVGIEPASGKRSPELDGIRGMAILLVLIWHYGVCQVSASSHPVVSLVARLCSYTWSGVDLFFVLSGFLLGGILLDYTHARNFFQVFYVRRFCRILPLYFCWVGAAAVITYAMPSLTEKAPFSWLFRHAIGFQYYATFTQNFVMAKMSSTGNHWLGITWSLAVEEQFYLLLPFLIYLFSGRRLWYVLICLIIMAPLLRTFFLLSLSIGFPGWVLMPCRIDALLMGVLCALALRQENCRQYIVKKRRELYALTGILFCSLMGMIYLKHYLISPAMTRFGYTLLALFYACIILIAVTERQGPVTAVVRTPWLCKLGVIAYSVYMFHQGIAGLAHALIRQRVPQITQASDALVTMAALGLTILCARFSWVYFEKPIVTWGHTWRYQD